MQPREIVKPLEFEKLDLMQRQLIDVVVNKKINTILEDLSDQKSKIDALRVMLAKQVQPNEIAKFMQQLTAKRDGRVGTPVSKSDVVAYIKKIVFSQINALQSREDVTNVSSTYRHVRNTLPKPTVVLNNFYHIVALQDLKKAGLTAQMLLTRNDGGHEFNGSHCFALIELVTKRGLSIDDALKSIQGLSETQARDLRVQGWEYETTQSAFRI